MELFIKYPGINSVMKAIKLQILHSIGYADENFSGYNTPIDLFTALRERLTYIDDPKGIEYIPTLKTLLEKNNGCGDCDCFTVAGAACLFVNNFDGVVILAGNTLTAPTHVYNGIETSPGKYMAFDLTESFYGSERKYKYKQVLRVDNIPIKI